MAKASVSVASRVYAPGTRTVGLPNLTTDDNGVKITFTREAWPDTGSDILLCDIDGSNDGQDWFNLMHFSYVGGIMLNPRTQQVVPICGPTVYWPEVYIDGVTMPQRPQQVRAVITNTDSLRTAITLQGV